MSRDMKRKFMLLVLALLVILAWIGPVDSLAVLRLEQGRNHAFATFAIARSINGAISLLREIQFSIPLVGGVSVAPGQMLAPADDLIEKFSTLMLASAIIFEMLSVLLAICSHWCVSAIITAVAALIAYAIFRQVQLPRWIAGVSAILVILRFAVPIVVLTSDTIAYEVLAKRYETSSKALAVVDGQLDVFRDSAIPNSKADAGTVEKLKARVFQANSDLTTWIRNLKDSAENFVSHVITLSVIFLMQTLVLPLLIFFTLVRIVSTFFRVSSENFRRYDDVDGLPRLKKST